MSPPETLKYKIVGAATWELIRATYLGGESARTCAERFGVSDHAIRRRATKEHWTKRDYAAALEARGLPPPERPKPLNIAERFAANYQPPPAKPPEPHPFMELVEALKQASAALEARQQQAGAEKEAAPDSDPQTVEAAALVRRALAQLSAALAEGRASDARALTGILETLSRRAGEEREAARVAEEEARVNSPKARKEREIISNYRYCLMLAHSMAHNPGGAPAIFEDLVAQWRREHLGEGTEVSLQAAREAAIASRRYFKLSEEEWQAALAERDAAASSAAPMTEG